MVPKGKANKTNAGADTGKKRTDVTEEPEYEEGISTPAASCSVWGTEDPKCSYHKIKIKAFIYLEIP